MSQGLGHFEHLYMHDADPWQVRTRWYEQRKQALLLASLPHRRYRRVFETACGTGALTSALADRCDELLASDGADAAVRIAREHLASRPDSQHVRIERQTLPRDWPPGRFDLVVIAEWAYYLQPSDLDTLVHACHDSLAPKGCLVACHWRPGFPDRCHATEEIHQRLGAGPGWTRLVHHEEDDFMLDVWSPSGVSVARGAESASRA